MRKLFIALFILCALSASLFAAEYNYWEITSPGTKYVRYQIADKPEGDWTIIEQKGQAVVYTSIDRSNPIYVSVSYDGMNWSETTVAYPPQSAKKASRKISLENELSVMVAQYSLEDIIFKEDGESILSLYGFGYEVSDVFVTKGGCRFGAELGFNSYVLPASVRFERLSEAFVGLVTGTQKTLGDAVLFMDVDGGAMVDLYEGNVSAYGYFGIKGGVGLQVTDSVALKGQLAAKASFQPKKSISDAYNLIVTPSFGVGYTF